MLPVDVLQAKPKLLDECNEFTTSMSGPGGLMVLLLEEVSNLSEDELGQLDMTDVEHKISEVQGIAVKVRNAQKDDTDNIKTELAQRNEEVETFEKTAQEAINAVKHILQSKGRAERLDKMRARSQDCKVADKLMAGGWPMLLAKIIAGQIDWKVFEEGLPRLFDRETPSLNPPGQSLMSKCH